MIDELIAQHTYAHVTCIYMWTQYFTGSPKLVNKLIKTQGFTTYHKPTNAIIILSVFWWPLVWRSYHWCFGHQVSLINCNLPQCRCAWSSLHTECKWRNINIVFILMTNRAMRLLGLTISKCWKFILVLENPLFPVCTCAHVTYLYFL